MCAWYIGECLKHLGHLRPGEWSCYHFKSRKVGISEFEQYRHLFDLKALAVSHPDIATALGNEYSIAPDLVVAREPLDDPEINRCGNLVDQGIANRTPVRSVNNTTSLLLT